MLETCSLWHCAPLKLCETSKKRTLAPDHPRYRNINKEQLPGPYNMMRLNDTCRTRARIEDKPYLGEGLSKAADVAACPVTASKIIRVTYCFLHLHCFSSSPHHHRHCFIATTTFPEPLREHRRRRVMYLSFLCSLTFDSSAV